MTKAAAIAFLSAAALLAASDAPQAAVSGGEIRGTLLSGGGASFLGVPFARPPVGPLRWREPMPVVPWTGVREATAYGSACAQMGRGGPSGSEDCLSLNLWTPAWPPTRSLPVMLWLYGGANATGSANNPIIDGANLARRGVIVVTANYRVGAMGFLAHPELSAESPHHASGNYGLLDEIAALRWIQANARRFGGDPRQVTLFGQSSGSYDLQVLLASPLAKGLFQHAIAESGQMTSYGGTMVAGRAEKIGEQVAAALGAPKGKDALAFLRGVAAEKIVAAAAPFLPTTLASDTGLLTSVDGWVLLRHPVQVYAAGEEMRVPLIVGNNAREITQPLSYTDLRAAIVEKYGSELARSGFSAYRVDGDVMPAPDPLLGAPGAQWMTDIVQRCGALSVARLHSAAGNPVYLYQFDLPTPGREEAGAVHGGEVPYVFGTFDRSTAPAPYSAADRAASDAIQRYWTTFARTGNPNGAGLPSWPRYDLGGGKYLEFTPAGPVAKENLRPAQCGVFMDWVRTHMSAPSPALRGVSAAR